MQNTQTRAYGAEIKEIYYVKPDEPFPRMYGYADFSPETIKNPVREGEEKTYEIIKRIRNGKVFESADCNSKDFDDYSLIGGD